MNIGEKIKELRRQKQMTQSEIAGESVSRNMVSLIENGRAKPSVGTLEVIASKLKVSAAFLMADAKERAVLAKNEKLSDIRIAFSGKNYRICADLCRSLYESGQGKDDEIDLIMAESLLENAKEAFFDDRIRLCCQLLDEAVFYAERTAYYSEHILGTAWTYFEYLNLLSPTLMSENLASDFSPEVVPEKDVFCRYIGALLSNGAKAFERYPEDPSSADLLARHLVAKERMAENDYQNAALCLSEILHSPDLLPGIVMYHVFSDVEACCRKTENQKNEENYREARLSVFEKLLS